MCIVVLCFFCFKPKTSYEMRISDWSSDVCSSDLIRQHFPPGLDQASDHLLPGGRLRNNRRGSRCAVSSPRANCPLVSFIIPNPRRRCACRSEERRVGTEWVSTCRALWWPVI